MHAYVHTYVYKLFKKFKLFSDCLGSRRIDNMEAALLPDESDLVSTNDAASWWWLDTTTVAKWRHLLGSTHQRRGILGYGTDTFFFWWLPLHCTLHSWPDELFCSRTCLRGGRFLQFNCNGIQHCQIELQDFLHHHQFVGRLCARDQLCVNSSLKEFTDYSTIRRDRPYINCYNRPSLRPL